MEAACERHADPWIPVYRACVKCLGTNLSLVIEGVFWHKKCHQEECE